MVAVELKQCSQQTADLWNNGKRYWYYVPVNNYSHRLIMEVNWGYSWFYADQWEYMKKELAEMGIRLTKKWYHVNRLREF